MKVVIPIVGHNRNGESHYFSGLREINRKMIFQHIYESLNSIVGAEFVVIIGKEDVRRFYFDEMLRLMIPDVKIIISEGSTSGAVCSVLLAIEEIKENESLVIASGNQLITGNLNNILEWFKSNGYDGGVITFNDLQPYWSYVKLNADNEVIETAEKRTISRNATVGIYYFDKGKLFIDSAKKIIQKNASVDGKYYICTCYNEMILQQRRIGSYKIKKEEYYNFDYDKDIEEFADYLERKTHNDIS